MNSNCTCVRSTTLDNFALDQTLSLGQTLSTFHYTLLNKCRALLSVVERGWPNALDFSLDLELNIPRMYYLMNNSFKECFVHYLMNSNCACVHSTTLDNFALDQTSFDKLQSSWLHSRRWQSALDISLNMHVERCMVKSRERLARESRALYSENSTKKELSTSLNKVAKRSRHFTQHFTQHACRALYSEKSRAFGQGLRCKYRQLRCKYQSCLVLSLRLFLKYSQRPENERDIFTSLLMS